MSSIVQAEGLVKHYGEVIALDGLDLEVEEGTILGLLGPNGAGKTTAVNILTTLLDPDSGSATVAGVDVLKDPMGVRRIIGLSGQYAAVDEHLTGYENLDMVGRLYHLGKEEARTRARELLERFDLEEAGDRPVKTYSGGMRRRLDLAGALVARSPVLFLDEPTTGLDPKSRAGLWDIIRDLVETGSTLLLTTQYLEEADLLADDIMVIDHGREIAHGTSSELKAQFGDDTIEFTFDHAEDLGRSLELLTAVSSGEIRREDRSRTLYVPVSNGAASLTRSLRMLDDANIPLSDVQMRRPTLDDVFLQLTGQHVEDEAEVGV